MLAQKVCHTWCVPQTRCEERHYTATCPNKMRFQPMAFFFVPQNRLKSSIDFEQQKKILSQIIIWLPHGVVLLKFHNWRVSRQKKLTRKHKTHNGLSHETRTSRLLAARLASEEIRVASDTMVDTMVIELIINTMGKHYLLSICNNWRVLGVASDQCAPPR